MRRYWTGLSAVAFVGFQLVCPHLAMAGDTDPCVKNYTVKGSFFTEKSYNTWQEFPDIPSARAFKPAYVYTAKAGWTVNHVDKDLGVISASRKVASSGSETLNVLIEDAGKGSKVTITRTESMGLVATKSEIQTEFCQIMTDVAKAAESN
jgi:2C-methyl-D-erythritol 2,4-cyclodiphosphate synthase